MTLIRHNVRTGDKQPVHYAHDTDQVDNTGCHVSGRTDKVFTSQAHPCPQCQGWGQVVPIRPLPRAEYPQGSIVPERYRLHTVGSEPVPVDMVPEPVDMDAEQEWCDECKSRGAHRVSCSQYPQGPNSHKPTTVQPVATETDAEAAAKMAQAMLAALVPEASNIRETIRQAVEQADTDARDRNNTALTEAIETLTSNFDETVKRLIVPTTIRIERADREPVDISGTVHEAFTECLEWLQARDAEGRPRNLYLTGPAGCGKTTLAKQLAQALDVAFYTTGTVLSEHQVTGFVDAGGRYHSTPYSDAFRKGGLWLGDEWDAWSPEATLAANSGLANGHGSFPDAPDGVTAHRDFYVIAAANTWGNGADREYVGRNELDAATISRFVTVPMDYDRALETALAGQFTEWRDLVWKVREQSRELRVRIMAGTRELVHGVAGLNAGMSFDRVATRVLRRNLSQAEWEKVAG